jgi:hypothetical protein
MLLLMVLPRPSMTAICPGLNSNKRLKKIGSINPLSGSRNAGNA